MRIDDYLSTVGIIKRRTIAKEMADNGLVEVNGRKVKPSYEVKINDIVVIKGSHPYKAEVIAIPHGSVAKEKRAGFFKPLP
jgi:ribosomal 50S subunit-recycling heat shock protein